MVDPALRAQNGLAPGIGVQLAASAGALALALVNQSEDANAIAIFSAGSRDNQYLMLSRLGLRPVSGIEPLTSTEYDDVIRVMYCARNQKLQRRFQRMMDAMAKAIGIDQMLAVSAGAIALLTRVSQRGAQGLGSADRSGEGRSPAVSAHQG